MEEYRKNIDGYWNTRSDPKKNKNASKRKTCYIPKPPDPTGLPSKNSAIF